VPFAFTTAIYLLIRSRVFEHAFGGGGAGARPYLQHALTQTHALVFYYLKAVAFPFELNLDREYPVFDSVFEGPVIAALVGISLLGISLLCLRRQRALVFWALWFPVCLLVTTYLTVLGQLVNEHRVYLSLAGACAVAGILLEWLRSKLPFRISDLSLGTRAGGALLTLLLALTAGVFALTTHARNQVWGSELTLWGAAARDHGTYRAHMNYALALDRADRADEALAEFQLAVERGPYAYPHMNLGMAYVRRGESLLGMEHLQTAVRLWPESPETHYFYALGLEQVGELEDAELQLHEALALRPVYSGAQRALVSVQLARGSFEPTLDNYEILIALAPERAPPHLFELAFGLQRDARLAEATPVYQQLLTLAPTHRQGTFNLAHAYMQSRDDDDLRRSIALFRKVLEIDSTYTEALFHLASLHWKLGDAVEAAALDREYLERGNHRDLRRQSQQRLTEAAS
jgi:tetratricopeptide (TPR) repeat protein